MANVITNPYSSAQANGTTLSNDFTDASGCKLVADGHAKLYNYAKAGVLFHGCSVIAGNALPIYSTTAPLFCLWNTSSAVNLVLLSFRLGYVSGTAVPAPVNYTWGAVGTTIGVPVTAFNTVTSSRWLVPGMLGSTFGSRASFSNAATNTIVALTNQIPGNMSYLTTTAATTSGAPGTIMQEDFDGSIILTPGTLFFPSALLASVSLFEMRLIWAEIPV